MTEPISIEQLKNASLDAKALEKAVNGNENEDVQARLGVTYPTLAKALRMITQANLLGATAFETYAEMARSSLTEGSYAIVTSDTPKKVGLYIKKSGAYKYVGYNALDEANNYTNSSERTNKLITISDGINTISDEDSKYQYISFTGRLTANAVAEFPVRSGKYIIKNATGGGFSVTIKTVGIDRGQFELRPGEVKQFVNNGTYFDAVDNYNAPRESPEFVGTPTAPTAPQGSESNQLATVSFAYLTHHGELITNLTGDITLNNDDLRRPILTFTGTAHTVTIPQLSGTRQWLIRNATNGDIRIASRLNALVLNRGLHIVYSNGSSLIKLDTQNIVTDAPNPSTPAPLNDVKPLSVMSANLTAKAAKQIPAELSRDRTRTWNFTSSTLDESFDGGETWTAVYSFAGNTIESVKELGNGELLVVTSSSDMYRKVWRSIGYANNDNVTFVECFKGHAASVKFAHGWSLFVHNNIVLVADYGPKAGFTWGGKEIIAEGANARYVRMSLNHGKTWQIIFDLNDFLSKAGYPTTGAHPHGIAYDKFWDRIWLSFGDNAYNIGGILYSDDLGKTWHWANEGRVDKDNSDLVPSGSMCQVVGILPVADAILFGTDTAPNGILKITRDQGKKSTGKYRIDVAFEINNDDKTTHLCQAICHVCDDQPAFFAFSSELQSAASCIVAYNGLDFVKIWEDSIKQPSGFGLRSVCAPTVSGELIAAHNDRRSNDTWTQVKGKAPIY